jgi:hypothetical protein
LVEDEGVVTTLVMRIVLPDGSWIDEPIPFTYRPHEFVFHVLKEWAYTATEQLQGVSEYELYLIATDVAGNSSVTGPVTVRVTAEE